MSFTRSLLLLLIAAGSCFAGPQAAAPAASSGSEGLARLADKREASQQDLIQMLARLARIDRSLGADKTVEELKHRRILSRGFRLVPDRPVTRADAAVPFAKALGLRGGMSGRIFGLGRRSALQELVSRGMLPAGPDTFVMTGVELLGLLDKARQFAATREGKP